MGGRTFLSAMVARRRRRIEDRPRTEKVSRWHVRTPAGCLQRRSGTRLGRRDLRLDRAHSVAAVCGCAAQGATVLRGCDGVVHMRGNTCKQNGSSTGGNSVPTDHIAELIFDL